MLHSLLVRSQLCSLSELSLSLVAMEPWIAKEDPYRADIYRRMDALIHQTHGYYVGKNIPYSQDKKNICNKQFKRLKQNFYLYIKKKKNRINKKII